MGTCSRSPTGKGSSSVPPNGQNILLAGDTTIPVDVKGQPRSASGYTPGLGRCALVWRRERLVRVRGVVLDDSGPDQFT